MSNTIGSVTLSSIASQLTTVYALLGEVDRSLDKLNNTSVEIKSSGNTAKTIAGLASLTHALRGFKELSGAGSETQMSQGIATLGTSLLALFKKIEGANIDKGVATLIRGLSGLLRNIKQLSDISGDDLAELPRRIADFIEDLAFAFTELPPGSTDVFDFEFLNKLTLTIRRMVKILKEDLNDLPKDFGKRLKLVSTIARIITDIIKETGKTLSGVKDASLMPSLTRLVKSVVDSIDYISEIFRDLPTGMFSNLKKINLLRDIANVLIKVTTKILQVVSTASSKKYSTKTFVNIIAFVNSLIESISELVSIFNLLPTDVFASFQKIRLLRAIANLLVTVSGKILKELDGVLFAKNSAAKLKSVQDFITGIVSNIKVLLDVLLALPTGFFKNGERLDALAKVTRILLDAAGDIMKTLKEVIYEKNSTAKLKGAVAFITGVASSVSVFAEVFKVMPTNMFSNISKVRLLRDIANVLVKTATSILKAVGQGISGPAMAALATMIKEIVNGITILFHIFNGLDISDLPVIIVRLNLLNRITRMLTRAIIQIFEPVTALIKSVSGEAIKLGALSSIFTGIATVVSSVMSFMAFVGPFLQGSVANIFRDVRNFYKLKNALGLFTMTIKDIVGATRDIKDAGAITAVGAIAEAAVGFLTAALSFFKYFESSGILSFVFDKRVKKFKQVLKEFANIVREIINVNIKVSPAQITAVSLILPAISSFMQSFIEVRKQLIAENLSGTRIGFFRLVGSLITMRVFLSTIMGLSKTTNPAQMSAAGQLFVGVGQFMEAFTKTLRVVGEEDRGLVGNAIKAQELFILIEPLVSLIKKVLDSTADVPLARLVPLSELMLALGPLLETMRKTNNDIQGATFGDVIKSSLKIMVMAEIYGRIIRRMSALVKGTNTAALTAAASIISSLGTVMTASVQVLDRNDKAVLSINLRGVLFFFTISNVLRMLIKSVIEMSKGVNPAAVRGVAKVIEALGGTFTSLAKLYESAPRGELTSDITQALSGVGDVLASFGKTLNKIKPQALVGGVKLLEALARIFESLINLTQSTGAQPIDTNVLEVAAKNLDSIVQRLAKIKIPFGFGRRIENIRSAVRSVLLALNVGKIQNNDGNTIGKSLESFAKFFEALSKFNGTSKIPDLGKLTNQIADLIEEVSNLDTFRLEALGVFALQLVEIQAEIEKALDKKKGLPAVADVIEKVKNTAKEVAPPLEKTSEALGANADRVQEVKEGFLAANLQITLVGNALRGASAALKFLVGIPFGGFRRLFAGYELLNQISQKLREIGTNIREAGSNLRDFGGNLISSFGIGAILNSSGFAETVNFDDIGNKIQVFGNLTDVARAQAEEFALEIGAKYPVSADQALSATLDLVKAGQSLENAKFILPSAADLAALSESGDLKAATTGLILAESTFKNFSDTVVGSFDNITVAANIQAAAADLSTASIDSLNAGLANSAVAANAAGLTFEETNAILAIFDQNGLKAGEGGTALGSVLTALTTPKTQSALDSLQTRVRGLGGEFANISLSQFDANGDRRSFTEFFSDVAKAINTLPNDKARLDVVKDLADTFGQRGLGILLNQGANAIGNMTAEMRALPSAAEKAAATLDSFKGDTEQLKGSVSTLLTVGIIPIIQKGLRPITKLARFVVDSILGMDRSVLEFIGTMAGLAATFFTVVGVIAVILGGLAQLGSVVFLVGSAFSAFLLAGTAITVFFASVAAGLVILVSALAVFLPILVGVTAVFDTLYKVFTEDIGGAATAVSGVFQSIAGIFKEIVSFGGEVIGIFSDILGGSASGGLEDFGAGIAGFFDGIKTALNSGGIQRFRDFLTGVTGALQGIRLLLKGDAFKNDVGDATEEELLRTGEGLTGFAKKIDKAYLDAIKSVAKGSKFFFRLIDRNRDGVTDNNEIAAFAEKLEKAKVRISFAFTSVKKSFSTFFKDIKSVGIGKAFTRLTGNLDSSLGNFTSVLLKQVESIFGIDLPDRIVNAFDGGFTNGINTLIFSLLENLRSSILANQKGLKDLFIGVMNIFFSPIKGLKFISEALGIDSLTNILTGIESLLSGLFGGIFDTVIGLLEGKDIGTALTDAFGEGITPGLQLLQSLGTTIGLVIQYFLDSIEKVINLFSGEGGLDGVSSGLGVFIGGLSGVIDTFNTYVLAPFVEGGLGAAIQSIVKNIFPLIGKAITDGMASLITFFGTGFRNLITNLSTKLGFDPAALLASLDKIISTGVTAISEGEEPFSGFAGTIVNLLLLAIETGVTSIGSLLGIDVTGILSALDATISANLNAIVTGGVGAVFAIAINSVVGLLGAILNTGFAAVGEALDIDTTAVQGEITESLGKMFDTIADIFTGGEDGLTLFDNIALIATKVADAIKAVIDALSPKQKPDEKITKSGGVLDKVVGFLGNIVAFAIETIASILGGINDFFTELAALDSPTLAAVAITMGAIFAVLVAPALLAAIPSLLLLAPALLALVSPILAFVGIGLLVKGVAENIAQFFDIFKELAAGNIGRALLETVDAIVNVIGSIIDSITDLFGLEFDRELFTQSIMTFIEGIATQVGGFINGIVKEINRIFDEISIRAELSVVEIGAAFNKARNVGDGGLEVVRDAFDNNKDTFSAQRFRDLFDVADMNVIRAFARANSQQVTTAYVQEYMAAGAVNIDDLSKSQTLKDFGLFVPIVDSIIASGNQGLQQDLLANVSRFGADQYLEIMRAFSIGLNTGTVPLENKDTVIAALTAGLTNYSEADKARIQLAMTQSLGVVFLAPVDTPLTIRPKVVFEDADPVEVQAGLETALGGDGEKPVIETALTLKPDITIDNTEFDITGIQNAADVALLNLDVTELTEKLQLLQTEFNNIIQPSTDVSAQLQLLTADIITTRTEFTATGIQVATTSLAIFAAISLFMVPPFQSLQRAIHAVIIELDTLMAFGQEGSPLYALTSETGNQFRLLTSFFNQVERAARGLGDRLGDVLLQLAAIQGQRSLGLEIDGGRAIGGVTVPGGLYRVTERQSEIFEENGKQYLLSSGFGKVKTLTQGLQGIDPLKSAMSPMMSAQRPSTTNLYSSSDALTVNGSAVTINVTVGAEANGTEIARQVGTQVRRELDRQTSSTKATLRANHRNI